MSAGGYTWHPDAATVAAGDAARVGYSLPTVEDGEQRTPAPSLVALRDVIVRGVRGVTSGGLVRDSARRVGRSQDAHRSGIACDAMLRNDGTREAVGSALAAWLVRHAQALGVQYVLFSNREWSASTWGPRWEAYTGSDPHHDHVHFEPSPEGRAMDPEVMRAKALDLLRADPGPLAPYRMGDAVTGASAGLAAVLVATVGALWWAARARGAA